MYVRRRLVVIKSTEKPVPVAPPDVQALPDRPKKALEYPILIRKKKDLGLAHIFSCFKILCILFYLYIKLTFLSF